MNLTSPCYPSQRSDLFYSSLPFYSPVTILPEAVRWDNTPSWPLPESLGSRLEWSFYREADTLAMRLTVLQQYARGVAQADAAGGKALQDGLNNVKGHLWHVNTLSARDFLIAAKLSNSLAS